MLAVSSVLFSITTGALAISIVLIILTQGCWPTAVGCSVSLHGIAVN